jgi:hypothetical protein
MIDLVDKVLSLMKEILKIKLIQSLIPVILDKLMRILRLPGNQDHLRLLLKELFQIRVHPLIQIINKNHRFLITRPARAGQSPHLVLQPKPNLKNLTRWIISKSRIYMSILINNIIQPQNKIPKQIK